MDRKWILILVFQVFYPKMTSGDVDKTLKEGDRVEIFCKPPDTSSTTSWFRVLDKSRMEFIASFDFRSKEKTPLSPRFSAEKMGKNILILKSFNKALDSGVYCCGILKNSDMIFGSVTRLTGVITRAPVATTAKENLPATTTACVCHKNQEQGGTSFPVFCSPVILGPLAGGCGLLLLSLIITTLYCNQIRTRRCPHHYKRKPRTMVPGKQMMPK